MVRAETGFVRQFLRNENITSQLRGNWMLSRTRVEWRNLSDQSARTFDSPESTVFSSLYVRSERWYSNGIAKSLADNKVTLYKIHTHTRVFLIDVHTKLSTKFTTGYIYIQSVPVSSDIALPACSTSKSKKKMLYGHMLLNVLLRSYN